MSFIDLQWLGGEEADLDEHNPIVPYGVVAVTIDTDKAKIGDGMTRWADLDFVV